MDHNPVYEGKNIYNLFELSYDLPNSVENKII